MTKFDKWKSERRKELENMGISEAIKRVKGLKEDCETSFYYEVQISDDRSEAVALQVVLSELGRLTQENKELKQKINDFVEEMRCME